MTPTKKNVAQLVESPFLVGLGLYIETEVHDVAVFYFVGFSFNA